VILVLGVLVATLLQAPQTAAPSAAASSAPATALEPAYLRRGDEVEARYRAFRERLQRDFEALRPRVEQEAPDLDPKLQAATPAAIPYGHRILPRMIPDLPSSQRPQRSTSTPFSWPRTEALIDTSVRKLEGLEAKLSQVSGAPPEGRNRAWENIVDDYVALAGSHRLINNQIEYNRLWQKEIARERPGYDQLTALHDAVIERQAILDAIAAGPDNVDVQRRGREQDLLRLIRQRTDVLAMPAFVRVEQPAPNRFIVRVPVYTDIEDASFLQAFLSAVETAWHVQDAGDEFRVIIDVRHVPASQLYPDGRVPARGEHIDLGQHIARFPSDGAILTTGANTTHVLGHSINVGPHDIAPRTLAHEFGHILGFVDGYFRGYHDLGRDGFEVLEIITDPFDIMSTPGFGQVHRRHFERLLARWKETQPSPVAEPTARRSP
jgi:hypothetical protein